MCESPKRRETTKAMGVGETPWGQRLARGEMKTRPNLKGGLDQEHEPSCHLSQRAITDLFVYHPENCKLNGAKTASPLTSCVLPGA